MPITKVPIVHKFGIISHSQRLELQERLLKQSYLETLKSKKPLISSRNPLDVTEEFVQEFNNVISLDEQEKKEALARKMLERIKRRAGMKFSGTGVYVDLPVAWTELAQLAQCKGCIQEECLEVLITSLDQAPIDKAHTPALFYLAETTLYWLRTESIHQPYLRTGELKLLRMGQLIFVRLFYHHMAGQLQGQHEFKNRLFTYLDGFTESQEAYAPYPNALLCLRYINEVGKMIIGDFNTEAGEIKEGDNLVYQKSTAAATSSYEKNTSDNCDMFHEVSVGFDDIQSSHSGAISSSVHDLSPTLWHSLDVWRCVNHHREGLSSATRSLGNCGMGLASESWLDGMAAMLILADSAKNSLQVLQTMQTLARGVKPKSLPATTTTTTSTNRTVEESETDRQTGDVSLTTATTTSAPSSKQMALSDIYEKTENLTSDCTDQAGSSSSEPSGTDGGEDGPSSPGAPSTSPGRTPGKEPPAPGEEEGPATARSSRAPGGREGTLGGQSEAERVADTAWHAEAGTDLPSGRASEASSVPTYSNQVFPDLPGLHGWHWEVATTYTDMLADICLHGSTSAIQKMALVGTNTDIGTVHTRASIPCCPMPSAALLDLVFFHAAKETHDHGPNDWSWRVRYSAIQGLVKLCRCLIGDATKDGLRTAAWNTLLKAHSMERDMRVLEALKVGQVDASIEDLIKRTVAVRPTTIGGKMAAGLSALYLPPLPSILDPPAGASGPSRRKGQPPRLTTKPARRKPLRTTLGEEIQLAMALYDQPVSYEERTGFDLRRIVEDQWRKDLQQKREEEEEEQRKDLEKKQEETEMEERHVRGLKKSRLRANKVAPPNKA